MTNDLNRVASSSLLKARFGITEYMRTVHQEPQLIVFEHFCKIIPSGRHNVKWLDAESRESNVFPKVRIEWPSNPFAKHTIQSRRNLFYNVIELSRELQVKFMI